MRNQTRPGRLRIGKILFLLKKEYPSVRPALRFSKPFHLLAATILSAQCTDARVNLVTESLFKRYKTLQQYAGADPGVFEQAVRSTGFYRSKARNILASAKKILEDFHGRVPSTMEGLLQLPGVARKTANVVLYGAFGRNQGVAVDTHVARLSQRLGLTSGSDPVKIERELMGLLDKNEWGDFSLRLIRHGRQICLARKPRCPRCFLRKACPSA